MPTKPFPDEDAATLDTERGSCDNSFCPCENCQCGRGCRCAPVSVPRVISAPGHRAIGPPADDKENVQFAFVVRGMTCSGCADSVSNAIASSSTSVLDVKVDLSSSYAFVACDAEGLNEGAMSAVQVILDAIKNIGFEADLDVSSIPEDGFEDTSDGVDSKVPPTEKEGDDYRKEEEQTTECGICLETLQRPVTLPCGHTFSSKCLEVWRSKYDAAQVAERTCPLCRTRMPPSREMLSQLASWRRAKERMEAEGDVRGAEYRVATEKVEELELIIGNCEEVMEDHAEEPCVELPDDIAKAAMNGDIQRVLRWIGPRPEKNCTCNGNCKGVYQRRLDAQDQSMMQITMLHAAAVNGHVDLVTILLQLGASVDPVDANGYTPLKVKSIMDGADGDITVRLLLEWGAELPADPGARREFALESSRYGNHRLAALLRSELGGRRCEILAAEGHTGGGGGRICVVGKYLPGRDRFLSVLEGSGEVFLVSPRSLRRQDRTQDDPGYYVTFKDGRVMRHDFTSREECRAFVASLNGGNIGDLVAEKEAAATAEARAEQAAEALLAELDLEESAAAAKCCGKKKGKKKRKKKRLG